MNFPDSVKKQHDGININISNNDDDASSIDDTCLSSEDLLTRILGFLVPTPGTRFDRTEVSPTIFHVSLVNCR